MQLKVKLIIAAAIVVSLYCPAVFAWRSFKIVFNSMPYELNSKYVAGKIEIVNKTGETAIDVEIDLKQELNDILLSAAIGIETMEGNTTTLINRTIDFCQFLNNKVPASILRMLYDDINRDGLLFKSCPLKPGRYALKSYHMNEELLPAFLPETKFTLDINLATSKGELLLKTLLKGKIDKSKGMNNLKMFSMG